MTQGTATAKGNSGTQKCPAAERRLRRKASAKDDWKNGRTTVQQFCGCFVVRGAMVALLVAVRAVEIVVLKNQLQVLAPSRLFMHGTNKFPQRLVGLRSPRQRRCRHTYGALTYFRGIRGRCRAQRDILETPGKSVRIRADETAQPQTKTRSQEPSRSGVPRQQYVSAVPSNQRRTIRLLRKLNLITIVTVRADTLAVTLA